MARELIATLLTDSNGEASHNYTGTGAGETTFIAESGDLESEPLVINDISEKLTLTSDKNILSYVDNDTATLTATYEGDTLEGKSVVFKVGDTVLATETTDSEGVATYTYSSQGVGDVTFTVECMNLQETFVIEDCIKTYLQTYTSQTGDIVNYNLPNEFKIEFILNSNNSSSTNSAFLRFNNSSGNFIGKGSSSNRNIYLQDVILNTIPVSADVEYTITYENGITTLSDGTDTVSKTGLSLTSLYAIVGSSNCQLKNIKIKPLPFDGSLSVSASKDILSYADEDECVLTATLTGDNVGNRPVVFKNGSTVLDTVNTDSNGIATYNYESQGVGDVTITVECMNLQETYVVEDCLKVWGNLTSTITPNYTMPNTPFEVDFTLTRQSGVGYVRIGTNTNNCLLFGQVGSDGTIAIARMNNGSYSNLQSATTNPSVNVAIPIKVVCDGSKYDLTIGNETISNSDVGQALTTLLQVYLTNNNSISNLRVKPL